MTDLSFAYEFLGALLIIAIHELGHVYMLWCFNAEPKIKFVWWGIRVDSDYILALPVWQVVMTNFFGVLSGLIVLLALFPDSTGLFVFYVAACSIDNAAIVLAISSYDLRKPLILAYRDEFRKSCEKHNMNPKARAMAKAAAVRMRDHAKGRNL